VPAGTPHSVRPAGDGTTRIVNVHQPALNHEAFFRDMHRLIEQGKIKRLPPGNPRPAISVGMLFDRSPDEIRSIKPPQAVFKALVLVGRALRFSH
jgi:hypothetical protein